MSVFTEKVSVEERDRILLHDRAGSDGQYFAVTMQGHHNDSPLSALVMKSFTRALVRDSKLPDFVREVEGMSGQVYRSFINNFVGEHPDARYLEIGSWGGSTATAAMYGNKMKCLCIDNWSQFGGPKDVFFA